MGAGGCDVQLSPAAQKLFPYEVECKSLSAVSVYKFYKQAQSHGKLEPLVVVKQNGAKPLAIIDFEHFMELVSK